MDNLDNRLSPHTRGIGDYPIILIVNCYDF